MGWLPEALSEEQREPSQKLTAKLAMQLTSLDPIRYLLLDHIGDRLRHSPSGQMGLPRPGGGAAPRQGVASG